MHVETKQKILEKAGALFYAQGYNNTGVDEITRVCGIKKPALYYHFESKTGLGLAYLEYRAELLFGMLDHLLERSASFDKYLSAWATALIMLAKRGEFFGCPFTAFASELSQEERPVFTPQLNSVQDRWLRFQARAYLKYHDNSAAAKQVARRVLVAHTGCVMLYRASRDLQYLKQLKAEFAAIAAAAEENNA
ncbi:MAG: TetR/AcrR family transcriptional regulator [Spirochaetota bacterium]